MKLIKRKVYFSLFFPISFFLLIWIIKIIEFLFDTSFVSYGIYPMRLQSLPGIITSPLIHGSFEHLISNSLPILLLNIGLFYFYKKIAYNVFFLLYFVCGFWLWFAGRESYHIGASGIIYGLAVFLFTSGLFRKSIPLTAISLLVSFLYGGLVWGIFPTQANVSWEGHLSGAIAGLVVAIYYRKKAPQAPQKNWETASVEMFHLDDDFSEYDHTGGKIFIKYT